MRSEVDDSIRMEGINKHNYYLENKKMVKRQSNQINV